MTGNPDEDFDDLPSDGGPNEAVRETVARIGVPEPSQGRQRAREPEADMGDETSPQGRLGAVSRESPEYDREYRLALLGRLLMRRIPLDQIARQFNVSVSTIKRDRAEFKRRVRDQAAKLDVTEVVGETIAYYQEIGGNAMRVASMEKTPQVTKLAALRTAAMARKEMIGAMNTVGVFDALKFEPGLDGTSNDMQKLVSAAEDALNEDSGDLSEYMEDVDELDDVHLL